MDGGRRRNLTRPTAATVLALVVAAASLGLAAGAALKVADDATHRGIGNYVSATGVGSWWISLKVATAVIPATVPPAASTTVGSPSVLPANSTSYVLNSATAGSNALVWTFVETTAAPTNTELELEFNVSVYTGPVVSVLVFVETQSAAPGSNLTVQFFYQTGVVTLTKIVVQSFTELSQQCSAVGTCP